LATAWRCQILRKTHLQSEIPTRASICAEVTRAPDRTRQSSSGTWLKITRRDRSAAIVTRNMQDGGTGPPDRPQGTIKPALGSSQDDEATVQGITFTAGVPHEAELVVELPNGFTDASGRVPRNAHLFPLKVRTGTTARLAKFAAAPLGIGNDSPNSASPRCCR
jgi:hypothetical protein